MINDDFSSDSLCTDSHPEQNWVEAVRQGEKEAFRLIFTTYYDPLTRFAYQYVKSGTEAENVVQDVFLRIWEKRESWQVDGTLKTYLFRAVKYKAIDFLRHEEVKRQYVKEQTALKRNFHNPLKKLERERSEEQFVKDTQNAIEELPERTRTIYKMSRVEGLTYNEIAKILEISPKTVEAQISRALQCLRRRLAKYSHVILMVKIATTFLFS